MVIPVADPLDSILNGGLPRGCIIELYGPDGCGKTTLAYMAEAAAQRQGLKVGHMDIEHSYNADHARFFGVKVEDVDFGEYPETAEEVMSTMSKMCEEKYGLIVLDSVAGLETKAMIEGAEEQIEDYSFGEAMQYSPIAGFLARTTNRLNKLAFKGETCVLMLNQVRANIQKFGMGSPTKSFGGYSLKHFASLRMEMVRVGDLKYSTNVIGIKSKIKTIKNRFAPSKREATLDIVFDHDFDTSKLSDKRRAGLNLVKTEE